MFATAPTNGSGARSVRQVLKGESRKMLQETTSIEAREQAFQLTAPRARILIVVDNRLAGRQLARMLMQKGLASVRAVTDAGRALIISRLYQPEIVFLDVTLTGDAYELARALRQQAGQAELRLIALTNSIEHSTREQARSAGFERWLVTPVTQEDLNGLLDDKSGLT